MGNWVQVETKATWADVAGAPAFLLGMKEAQKGLPLPRNIIAHLHDKGADRLPPRIPQSVHNAETMYERGRMFFLVTGRKPSWQVHAPKDVELTLNRLFREKVIL